MGEAKRRGSFEERKAEAILKRPLKINQDRNLDLSCKGYADWVPRNNTGLMKTMLLLASCMSFGHIRR
jgi:hypothetical protein